MFISSLSSRTVWWRIVGLVLTLHILILWLGMSWSVKPPQKKAEQRVIVKTIPLQSKLQPPSETKVAGALPLPPLPVQEEPLIAQTPKTPEPLPVPEQPLPAPATPPVKDTKTIETPPPAPAEKPKETKKATPAAKPAASSAKKTVPAKKADKPAPVKKAAEPAKKPVKKETPPKKDTQETEKKKRKEKELAAAKEAEKQRLQEIAAAEEAARKQQQELLQKTKDKLAKIGEARDKIGSLSTIKLEEGTTLKPIGSLQIDALPVGSSLPAALNAKEASYRDEVAQRLKAALKLPDYGAVKIKLTLHKTGKVSQVTIISSESQKNQDYIEREVRKLIFSAFGTRFEGAEQYTFLITLNND